MKLEESTFLISDYTPKLKSSRQYGSGTKNRNIDQWNKIGSQRQAHAPMDTLSLTKEARIHNGEKTASSMSGAVETGGVLTF